MGDMEWIPCVWNGIQHILEVIKNVKTHWQLTNVNTSLVGGEMSRVSNALDRLRKYILGEKVQDWPTCTSQTDLDAWMQRAINDWQHIRDKVGVPVKKMEHVLKVVDPNGAWRMLKNPTNDVLNLDWNALEIKRKTDTTLDHYMKLWETFQQVFFEFNQSGCDKSNAYQSIMNLTNDEFGYTGAQLLANKARKVAEAINDIATGRMICPYGNYVPTKFDSEDIPNREFDAIIGIGSMNAATKTGTWAHMGVFWTNSTAAEPWDYGISASDLFTAQTDKLLKSWNIKYQQAGGDWIRPAWYDFKTRLRITCGTLTGEGSTLNMLLHVVMWHGNDASYTVDDIVTVNIAKQSDTEKVQKYCYNFDVNANMDSKVTFFVSRREPGTGLIDIGCYFIGLSFDELIKIPNGKVVDYDAIQYIDKDGNLKYLVDPATSYLDLLGKCKLEADLDVNFNVVTLWDEVVTGIEVDLNNLIVIMDGYCWARNFEKIDIDAPFMASMGPEFTVKDFVPVQRWIFSDGPFAAAINPYTALLSLSNLLYEMASWLEDDPDFAKYAISILNTNGDCTRLSTKVKCKYPQPKKNCGYGRPVVHSTRFIHDFVYNKNENCVCSKCHDERRYANRPIFNATFIQRPEKKKVVKK